MLHVFYSHQSFLSLSEYSAALLLDADITYFCLIISLSFSNDRNVLYAIFIPQLIISLYLFCLSSIDEVLWSYCGLHVLWCCY